MLIRVGAVFDDQQDSTCKFIVDTGSCQTVVPAFRANEWGHDNAHPDVKPFEMDGIGFPWTGHWHSFRFGLLCDLLKPPVWESEFNELCFVNELTANYGLLGMDVIRQWKEFKLVPTASGGKIFVRV